MAEGSSSTRASAGRRPTARLPRARTAGKDANGAGRTLPRPARELPPTPRALMRRPPRRSRAPPSRGCRRPTSTSATRTTSATRCPACGCSRACGSAARCAASSGSRRRAPCCWWATTRAATSRPTPACSRSPSTPTSASSGASTSWPTTWCSRCPAWASCASTARWRRRPQNADKALDSGAALLVYPGGDYEVHRPQLGVREGGLRRSQGLHPPGAGEGRADRARRVDRRSGDGAVPEPRRGPGQAAAPGQDGPAEGAADLAGAAVDPERRRHARPRAGAGEDHDPGAASRSTCASATARTRTSTEVYADVMAEMQDTLTALQDERALPVIGLRAGGCASRSRSRRRPARGGLGAARRPRRHAALRQRRSPASSPDGETEDDEPGVGARYRMRMHVGSADVGGLIEVVESTRAATSPGRASPASTSAGAGGSARHRTAVPG